MKREEKSALSKQRILNAALREFSEKGYEAASLNVICAENDISKGIIYHYYKDKDELYLSCAADCFAQLTEYLRENAGCGNGSVGVRLQAYFDARLRFFAEKPLYLGFFLHAVQGPPEHLAEGMAAVRAEFDSLNIAILTGLLESVSLRRGLKVETVVEDFRMYMDYFHARFQLVQTDTQTLEEAMKDHEERCHRQVDMLLYGVLGQEDENWKR